MFVFSSFFKLYFPNIKLFPISHPKNIFLQSFKSLSLLFFFFSSLCIWTDSTIIVIIRTKISAAENTIDIPKTSFLHSIISSRIDFLSFILSLLLGSVPFGIAIFIY